MGHGSRAESAVRPEHRTQAVKITAVSLPFQGVQHFRHQIIDVQHFQPDSGVADLDGQVVGVVIAEGSHHAVVVRTAPFAKEIGEPVHQHPCPGFLGIAEEQVLPCLLGLAVVPFRVTANEGGLNGGREHHRAGVVIFFQGTQQRGGEAKVSRHEFFRVLGPVHPGKIENKVRVLAAFLQSFRGRILVVKVEVVNRKVGSRSVRAVSQAAKSCGEIFSHESGGTGNQDVHSGYPLSPFPGGQPAPPGCRQGTEAFPSPAPRPAAGCCWS